MSRKFYPYPADYRNTASLRRARRGGNIFTLILVGIIVLLLGAGAYFAFTDNMRGWDAFTDFIAKNCLENPPSPKTQPAAEAATPATVQVPAIEEHLAMPFDPTSFSGIPDVVDAVTPGVVGILNYQRKTAKSEPALAGSGSGFIYTENGYIITNITSSKARKSCRFRLRTADLSTRNWSAGTCRRTLPFCTLMRRA